MKVFCFLYKRSSHSVVLNLDDFSWASACFLAVERPIPTYISRVTKCVKCFLSFFNFRSVTSALRYLSRSVVYHDKSFWPQEKFQGQRKEFLIHQEAVSAFAKFAVAGSCWLVSVLQYVQNLLTPVFSPAFPLLLEYDGGRKITGLF